MKKKCQKVVLLLLIITVGIMVISCRKAEYHEEDISQIYETEIMIADLDMPEMENVDVYADHKGTSNTTKTTDTTKPEISEPVTDNVAEVTNESNSGNQITESNDTIMTEKHDRSQYDRIIMVGDSRFNGMSAVSDHPACVWICEDGIGYSWLEETAASLISDSIVENSAIVFNLGVNDPDNKNKYTEFINSKINDWVQSGADIYFMTVNPVDNDKYSGSVTNNIIEDFNNTLMSKLSQWVAYIDTYNYLIEYGFETSDGLHYENSTYKNILEYCLRQLRVE